MNFNNIPIMQPFQTGFNSFNPILNNFSPVTSYNVRDSIFTLPNTQNFQTDLSFNTDFSNINWNNNFNLQLNSLNSKPRFVFFNNLYSKISNNKTKTKNGKTYNNTTRAVNTSTWNNFKKAYGVTERTINGSKVYACRWSSFSKSQPEWLGLQRYMIEAAEELGLTLVYSDMDRSVSASNAARKKKGNIVAAGGKSPHNYGTACDICLFKDGVAVSAKSALFRQFAELAKQKSGNKIAWGGDWRKKNEEHHFELRDWKKYKTNQHRIV